MEKTEKDRTQNGTLWHSTEKQRELGSKHLSKGPDIQTKP